MRRAIACVLATAALGGSGIALAASGPPRGGGVGWQPDVAAARAYAKSRSGTISFAVIGLDHRMRAYHPAETAPAASVFKVMLLATYLRRSSVRHRELTSADKRLLGPMIRVSDSVAATRVRDIVGVPAIERLARDAGMKRFKYNTVWGLSRIDAVDQVRFMYHLMRFIPSRHRAYARFLLSHIVPSQSWGVGRVKPPGWKLYFKGGWATGTGRVDHQVAYLARHGHKVAIAILTQFDPSHLYGEETLKGISARLLRGLPRLPHHP
jgi:Beta-lactamase enzyme family